MDLDGASGLMELFRGSKISDEVASKTMSATPPKKRRLESIPASASAPQPKARPSSTSNRPVAQPLYLANVCSTNVANTLAVELSLVPSFGRWPFAQHQQLQNTYVSPPMVFMPAATRACTPNKRKKLYDTNMPQSEPEYTITRTPAPAAARPVAIATPLAQLDYQQHLLAQSTARSSMAYGTIFSPQCKTPSQVWQQLQQLQQLQQQQALPVLPLPRAPAVQQQPRSAYPAAGKNCQMAARWQALLHALLSRADLAENNHRLLDPIATCNAWEVPSRVLHLPARQVDVLHPELRSLIVHFQRDLASTKPAVYKAQLHARAMPCPVRASSVEVLAGQAD